MISSESLLESKNYTHRKGAITIELAEMAYIHEGKPKTDRKLKQLGFNQIKHISIKSTDTQCTIVSNEDSIVIAMRGSESKADWKNNLNFRKTETKYGKIHGGFFKAAMSVVYNIVDYITLNIKDYESKNLYITGHSLGASLTGIVALVIEDLYDDLIFESVWMHASPRWASKKVRRLFRKQFKKRAFRSVHNNDIVCRVPLLMMGFRHVGKLIYISAAGRVRTGLGRIFRPVNRFYGHLRNIGDMWKQRTKGRAFDPIDDHRPFYYFNAFSKAAKEDRKLPPRKRDLKS